MTKEDSNGRIIEDCKLMDSKYYTFPFFVDVISNLPYLCVWHYFLGVYLVSHYSDVIMAPWCLKSLTSWLFAQPFVQTHIEENITQRYWPLWGESNDDRWIALIKGQWHGKCLHMITSSCKYTFPKANMNQPHSEAASALHRFRSWIENMGKRGSGKVSS